MSNLTKYGESGESIHLSAFGIILEKEKEALMVHVKHPYLSL